MSEQRPGVPTALASQRRIMSPPMQYVALGLEQLILVPEGMACCGSAAARVAARITAVAAAAVFMMAVL